LRGHTGHLANFRGQPKIEPASLYNNAAWTRFTPVHEMALADWQTAIRGELDVVFLGCKHALPHMMRRGRGAIVNTASISALVSTELPRLARGWTIT